MTFVGENGDTDYEGLLGGMHKTVVLKGVCKDVPKFYSNRTYPLEHVLPIDSPNIIHAQVCNKDGISAALRNVGVFKS